MNCIWDVEWASLSATVITYYLTQHGFDGAAALARLALLRQGTPDSRRRSPETDAQCAFVLAWVAATSGRD